MKRIPTLDGWRGIAILLVLSEHFQIQWFGQPIKPWLRFGQHGVTLFFVLSGYLITTVLLEGRSNLRAFYIRRFFRLMPVAWSYLLFMLALSLRYPAQAMPRNEFLSCIFFFRNYVVGNNVLNAGHFWSLSIEEQFYLIWPVTLLLLGKNRARWVLGFITLLCAIIRLTNLQFYDRIWYCFHTEVRADALCIGCLAAIFLNDPALRKRASSLVDRFYLPSLLTFCACAFTFPWLPPVIECCAIALLLARAVLNPNCLSSRLISWKPLAYLGLISYSVYVWQQFFLEGFSPAMNLFLDLALLIVAISSYYIVEKPFLALGRRATRRLSTGDCTP